MMIDLSLDDARFLHAQMSRHLEEIENELIHTDKHELQREIAADARRLRSIIEKMPAP